MNHPILLTWVAGLTLIGSMLNLLLMAGQAAAIVASASKPTSCSIPVQPEINGSETQLELQGEVIAAASTESPIDDENSLMDFTAAESDAAVDLFGCDCPSCIRSLRQLQSQTLSQVLLSSNQGHCWNALQRRVSPQEAQDVLQRLEEANE